MPKPDPNNAPPKGRAHSKRVTKAKRQGRGVATVAESGSKDAKLVNKVGDTRGVNEGAQRGYFRPGNPYRFKPGVSGNPSGMPATISGSYRRWLQQVDPASGLTNADLIAESAGADAIDGDNQARREIRQATEGDIVRWTDEQLLGFILGDDNQQPGADDADSPSGSEAAGLADTASGATDATE